MPRVVARQFNLADVMILVAATGFSLCCYVLLDNAAFGGRRYFYGLFEWPRGWDFDMVMERAAGVSAALLLVFGGWTLVLPILRLRGARSGWRRLGRQPGMTACVAAIVGIGFCAAVAGGLSLLTWWIDGSPWPQSRPWRLAVLLDHLVTYAGLSVAAVWITQVVTGRWRRSTDWIDRLGRCLGGLWLVVGFILAMRYCY